MKKIIPILAIFTLILSSFIFTPVLAVNSGGFLDLSEQEGFEGGEIAEVFGEDDEPADIRLFAANLIRGALGLLGIIFITLLVVAGYKYMVAQGNEEQITEAKKQITQAIIGLILIMSAYGITLFVIELVIKGSDGFWIF